jgi:hypothetical protein
MSQVTLSARGCIVRPLVAYNRMPWVAWAFGGAFIVVRPGGLHELVGSGLPAFKVRPTRVGQSRPRTWLQHRTEDAGDGFSRPGDKPYARFAGGVGLIRIVSGKKCFQ